MIAGLKAGLRWWEIVSCCVAIRAWVLVPSEQLHVFLRSLSAESSTGCPFGRLVLFAIKCIDQRTHWTRCIASVCVFSSVLCIPNGVLKTNKQETDPDDFL